MKTLKIIALLAGAVLGLPLTAEVLTGVTVTADSVYSANQNVDNLINNSGLSEPVSLDSVHSPHGSSAGMWHSELDVIGDTNLDFNLNGSHHLLNLHIWQHNQSGNDFGNRGVRNFDVLISTDGGLNYTAAHTDLTLAQAAPPDPVAAQVFPLEAEGVTHVRLHLLDNYGGVVIGLAEVKFETVPGDPGLDVAGSFHFGEVNSVQTAQASIAVSNPGISQSLTISSVVATGFDETFFTINRFPASLAPGESGTIDITFDPAAQRGPFQITLEISSNQGGVAGTIAEVIVGAESILVPDPELIAPATFEISTLPGEPIQVLIPLLNEGPFQALNLAGVVVTGADAANFTVDQFPLTLGAAGGSGSIAVTFDPGEGILGVFHATLAITSDSVGGSGVETMINLSARAQIPSGFAIIPMVNASGGVPWNAATAGNPADVTNDPFGYVDDIDPEFPGPNQIWPNGMFLAHYLAGNAFWQTEFSGTHQVERLDVWGRTNYVGSEANRHQTLRIEFFLGGWEESQKVGEIPSWSGVRDDASIPPSFGSLHPAEEGLSATQRTADRMRISQTTPDTYLLLAEVRGVGVPVAGEEMRILDVTRADSAPEFSFTWESEPETTYTIRRTRDLSSPLADWEVLSDEHPSGGVTTTYSDSSPTDDSQRFYVAEKNES